MTEITDATAWLRSALARRIAVVMPTMMPAIVGMDAPPQMVLIPLTDPPSEEEMEVRWWERCCDRCGSYTPAEEDFNLGSASTRFGDIPVVITFGLCTPCAAKELVVDTP